jgi:hypothetical protein
MDLYRRIRLKFSRFRVFTLGVALAGVPAWGMTINFTYNDGSINALANALQVKTDLGFAANAFTSLYNDPITINIDVKWNAGIGGGQSLFSNNYLVTNYNGVRNALINDAKSADDATATAVTDLPLTDPSGGATRWVIPSAQAKALGLILNQTLFDGTITFGDTNGATPYTFDPNNRAVVGQFDFLGVAEHEISEIMGRTTQLSNTGFGFLPFDLFRFTANGTRAPFTAPNNGVYFSFDNGASNLKSYNPGPPGDAQDWDSSNLNDAFNASIIDGTKTDLTPVDVRVMDVIGYDLAAPEPSQFLPVAGALGLLLVKLRRRF